MTVDETSNLIPPAKPHSLPVPWPSPRPDDGGRLLRDRETTEVPPPELVSTLTGWPRVFPGL